MDTDRFENLLRSLSASPSRRSAVRFLAGLVLGRPFALGGAGTEAHDAAKKCKKLDEKAKKKQCLKKAKKHNAQHRQPSAPLAPPVEVLAYQCPGPGETSASAGSPGTTRLAQTFSPAQSGSLLQIQFAVSKAAGSTGDYLVQLLAAVADVPTNTVLAQAIIPNASVPAGPSTLTASFSGPALAAGTEYAAAISRPGGTDLTLQFRRGNQCLGRAFSQAPSGSGAFTTTTDMDGTPFELVTFVTVLA